jgi:hypothetical protein
MSSPPGAQLCTGSGNPYAAASRFGKVANGFCSNKRRWLWVPAFRGDDAPCVARSHTTNCSRFNFQTASPCADTASRSRGLNMPEVCQKFPYPLDRRAQGIPGARCTRGLVCKVHKETHTSIQVQRRQSGIPRAMVYGLSRALPGDRAFLPPSPLRSLLLKNLTPASGRQDHTTSPSASGAFVKGAIHVHRIPPHVCDDRETPP